MSTSRRNEKAPRPDRSAPEREAIRERLRRELRAARELTPQVLGHLLSEHEVTASDVVEWLGRELESLEGYELDLLLSPLFTPDFEARLGFEEALGHGALTAREVDGLIRELAAEGLTMTLVFEAEEIRAPLPEVLIDRYVRLLHLDSALPEEAFGFGELEPAVRCHLRDRTWSRPQIRALIPALFDAARRAGGEFRDQVRFLTDFLRTHRPASLDECRAFLENFARAYEEDLERYRSGTRSFFDEELKAAYAGKWSATEDTVTAHRRAIAMAQALLAALGG